LTGLGYNVDPFADIDLLVTTLRKNPAPMCVVQNDLGKAERLRREFPSMRVVYRITTQDNPDDNAQRHFTPTAYLDRSINMGSFVEAARMGAYIYVNNEPDWAQSLDWCRQVGEQIVARGWRGILGNWSVGVPEADDVPAADALFRLAHAHRDRLILGWHEYFPYGYAAHDIFGPNVRPFAEWPNAAPADSHLLGRMRRALVYCRSRGYRINAAITEYGSDTVHASEGMRAVAGASTSDRFGWQLAKLRYPAWGNLGLPDSETAYAKSLAWGWRVFYQPWPEIVGAALFCFGRFGDWRFYDVSDNQYLLDLIAKEDFPMSSVPAFAIESDGSRVVKATVSGAVVNVRTQPHTGANVITQLRPAQVVEYFDDSKATGSGYEWRRLASGGWFALVPGLVLTPVNSEREALLAELDKALNALEAARTVAAAWR
jgi:hypothetical protein